MPTPARDRAIARHARTYGTSGRTEAVVGRLRKAERVPTETISAQWLFHLFENGTAGSPPATVPVWNGVGHTSSETEHVEPSIPQNQNNTLFLFDFFVACDLH
jgi:hypothetical protein